jgi:drug/metabolite transporter (DMT)-like permease
MAAERRGVLLLLMSAGAYGTMPILARVAYAENVPVAAVLAYRFLFASGLFALLRRRGTKRPPLRQRLVLWGLGAVFLGNTLSYFLALQLVPVSVLTLLLYSYPVLVALISALAGIEPLTARGLLAAGLAFSGSALTAGSLAGANPLGIALALATALVYSVYLVLASRFARSVSSEESARHLAEVALVVYGVAAAVRGELLLHTSPKAWAALFGIGAICTVLALRGLLAGLALVGPSRTAVLSSFEVIVALALATLFLGERPSWRVGCGGALIVSAVALQRRVRG